MPMMPMMPGYNPYYSMMMPQQFAAPMHGMVQNGMAQNGQNGMPMMMPMHPMMMPNQPYMPGTQMGPQIMNLSTSQERFNKKAKKKKKKRKYSSDDDENKAKLNDWQAFNKYTVPKLQVRKVMKIQALFRGAYVRKKIIPTLKNFHRAAKAAMNTMVQQTLEMKIIPDIIVDIISHNRVYENFGLYSEENRIYYQVRESILQAVLRPFIHQIIKQYTNRMVNDYLNKRFADKNLDQRDPLRMASSQILVDVLRQDIREIARQSINELVFEYMTESQLIVLYNRGFIQKMTREVVEESVQDFAKVEFAENLVSRSVASWMPLLIEESIQEEEQNRDQKEAEEIFRIFLERLMLQESVEYLQKATQEEERLRILQEKKMLAEKQRKGAK